MSIRLIAAILLMLCCPGKMTAQAKVKELEYKIIELKKNSFGYDIYQDGKMIVHQNSIPAVEGNKGFTTRKKAAKVARLVIIKIKNGEMPPAVTKEEMKKIGAL